MREGVVVGSGLVAGIEARELRGLVAGRWGGGLVALVGGWVEEGGLCVGVFGGGGGAARAAGGAAGEAGTAAGGTEAEAAGEAPEEGEGEEGGEDDADYGGPSGGEG